MATSVQWAFPILAASRLRGAYLNLSYRMAAQAIAADARLGGTLLTRGFNRENTAGQQIGSGNLN